MGSLGALTLLHRRLTASYKRDTALHERSDVEVVRD